MFDLAGLQPEHFECLIGQALPLLDSPFAFTVQAVTRLPSPSPRGQPFSLSLLAPANTQGGQGIYRLQHPELGELALFLVPQPPRQGQSCFEAIFN
jgi:hypothetical protein